MNLSTKCKMTSFFPDFNFCSDRLEQIKSYLNSNVYITRVISLQLLKKKITPCRWPKIRLYNKILILVIILSRILYWFVKSVFLNHFDCKWTARNMLIAIFNYEHILSLVFNAVCDVVLLIADVFDDHFFAGCFRPIHAHH